MYGDCVCKVDKKNNGWVVTMNDPKIVEANRKRKTDLKEVSPYRDPEQSFVFQTVDQVLEFLKNNLDKTKPVDDYSSSFQAASAEMSDEE